MVAPITPKFALGHVVATPGALATLTEAGQTPTEFISRHVSGDWGECGDDDLQANEEALQQDGRLFSVYRTAKGVKFWIITEADRSSTCVLLPEDY